MCIFLAIWHFESRISGPHKRRIDKLPPAQEGLESAETALSRLTLQVKMAESIRELPVDPLVQVGGADIIGKWYFQASQAPVVVCEELRQKPNAEAGKTTKHLEFDIKQLPGVSWRTADNLEVLPQNHDDVVEWFAERLKVNEQLEHYLTFTRTNTTKPVKQLSLFVLFHVVPLQTCLFPQERWAFRTVLHVSGTSQEAFPSTM